MRHDKDLPRIDQPRVADLLRVRGVDLRVPHSMAKHLSAYPPKRIAVHHLCGDEFRHHRWGRRITRHRLGRGLRVWKAAGFGLARMRSVGGREIIRVGAVWADEGGATAIRGVVTGAAEPMPGCSVPVAADASRAGAVVTSGAGLTPVFFFARSRRDVVVATCAG